MEAADSLNQTDIDFASLVSHQLSTPLTGIRWNAKLLRAGEMTKPLDTQQAKLVDEIILSATRMTDLLSDIHDSAWLEQDKFIDKPTPTTLTELVAHTQYEYKAEITRKKLRFTLVADPATPSVTARPSTLLLIVQNLLSNAIKYTPTKGSIRVELRAATQEEAARLEHRAKQEAIFLCITDTGMGIPADEQTELFHRFFRAENVRSTEIDGTGLGLYIVDLAITKLGGAIWLESTENKGTTFSVVLPCIAKS